MAATDYRELNALRRRLWKAIALLEMLPKPLKPEQIVALRECTATLEGLRESRAD